MDGMTTTLIPLHMGGPGFFFFVPMLIPLLLIGAALFLLLRKGRLGPVRFAPGARGGVGGCQGLRGPDTGALPTRDPIPPRYRECFC